MYGVLKCQEFSIFSGFAYNLIYCQFLFYLTRAKFGKQCVIIFVIGFRGANSKLAIIIVYSILIRIFDGIKITFIKNFFGENGFRTQFRKTSTFLFFFFVYKNLYL